jgi:hypothetical protein
MATLIGSMLAIGGGCGQMAWEGPSYRGHRGKTRQWWLAHGHGRGVAPGARVREGGKGRQRAVPAGSVSGQCPT